MKSQQIIIYKGRECVVVQSTEHYYLVYFKDSFPQSYFSVKCDEIENTYLE